MRNACMKAHSDLASPLLFKAIVHAATTAWKTLRDDDVSRQDLSLDALRSVRHLCSRHAVGTLVVRNAGAPGDRSRTAAGNSLRVTRQKATGSTRCFPRRAAFDLAGKVRCTA